MKNLTWAKANGDDDTSRRILAGGRKPTAIPGGAGGGWIGVPVTASSKKYRSAPGEETATSGTSIFDPVLCELAYRWFSPADGVVLDPFAGGSVRGIVASQLGRQYVGIDLRPEQLEANRIQAAAICGDRQPLWIEGDSRDIDILAPGVVADFIFSCHPMATLKFTARMRETYPPPATTPSLRHIGKSSENRWPC